MRSPAARARLRWILQVVFIAILLYFVVRYFDSQWSQLDWSRLRVDWGLLALGLLAHVVGMGLLPLASWCMQRWMGFHVAAIDMWQAFFLAQMAKYLPGGFWSLPGRAVLYHRQGLTAIESSALVLLEVLGMLCGAGVVGLLSLPVFLALVPDTGLIALFAAAAAVMSLIGLRYLLPRLRGFGVALRRLSVRGFAALVLIYALNWLVLGAAFGLLALAVSADLRPSDFAQIIGLHAVAWAIGFVIIFAPSGIGVREAVLTFGLLAFMDAPLPLTASILGRIGWTLAELVNVGIITVIKRRERCEPWSN
jgi:uncharacterized membrane protein YbhN (UPF0104 family)